MPSTDDHITDATRLGASCRIWRWLGSGMPVTEVTREPGRTTLVAGFVTW